MVDNVFVHPTYHRDSDGGNQTGGGGPGGPGDMEQRVANLEQVTADMRETLARLDERTDSMEKHGATKADLTKMESTMIRWFVGTAVALAALAFGAASIL